ncbi:MAG: phosphopantothenate/pantothenate synthetase [Candidatus Bathyarchaeota archaeon]|nr:phosphopantothenate/pantothenate synthetase [Candidatus Bathyarchaeota archaeon]MDH5792840.1 phosphopantothenate/pantothenate synthetase [Candidatus Bathyarchaeota archaeon]
MTEETHVLPGHPRAESIRIRERLTRSLEANVLTPAGLIAHGRGEAFDYILGERTTPSAMRAITASAATLLLAERPVISVNGNVAALCACELVELARASDAKLEVNLFHRLPGREEAIEKVLRAAGADDVLGVGGAALARIEEVNSERRRVDPRGILVSDVVLVPLEDGDRTEALVRMDKTVIAVDLNPLSRTAQFASITIVDNVVRAMPLLVSEARRLRGASAEELRRTVSGFSNKDALSEAMRVMEERLHALSEKGVYLELHGRE